MRKPGDREVGYLPKSSQLAKPGPSKGKVDTRLLLALESACVKFLVYSRQSIEGRVYYYYCYYSGIVLIDIVSDGYILLTEWYIFN